MRLKSIATRALGVLFDPGAVAALVTWPTFSVTSYEMVSALSRQGIQPRTVIDVGANVGQFAVAAAKIFPDAEVHSFEPLPDCVERLRRNVRGLKNVAVFPLAIGDAEGECTLHVNSHSHSSSILALSEAHRSAFPYAREIGKAAVKLSTLDAIFASRELQGPVLLKLDIQGYEDRALRGASRTLTRVDFIVAEASLRRMYEGESLFMDLARKMEEIGFDFARPVGSLADPRSGEILQIDALFMRRDTGR